MTTMNKITIKLIKGQKLQKVALKFLDINFYLFETNV
jgi:hypothetical protein